MFKTMPLYKLVIIYVLLIFVNCQKNSINKNPYIPDLKFDYDINLNLPEYDNLKLDIEFFTFNENLNFKDFDLIISRSGSGSLHEILYFNNKVYFIPHLHSRDGHQSLNLRYFKENSYSLKDFEMPISKKISKEYLNSLINPFSMQKILCYLTR